MQEQTYLALGQHIDKFHASKYFEAVPETVRAEQRRRDDAAAKEAKAAQRKDHMSCFAFL